MIKKISILIILIAMCNFKQSHAQAIFQKTFGGSGLDVAFAIQQTTDGGYISVGRTSSFGAGGRDMYLIKTDSVGNTLWTKTYGGGFDDWPYAVEQTTDGGYIVGGWTSSFGAGSRDAYLIKTDANGDTLWTKTYGGIGLDYAWAVQQTTDGGYIVAGETTSFGAGFRDVYLIKIDSLGVPIWTRTYGGDDDDVAYDVKQTNDGGYIVSGNTWSFGAGGWDVYLIKTDANGDTLWTKTYGGAFNELNEAVQQTTDGGYIIAGETRTFGAGMADVYLIKTDSVGDTLWTKTYGRWFDDGAYAVEQTTDGGYIVGGITESFGAGGYDVYLIKTAPNGDTLWTKAYGGGWDEYGYAVKQTTDGGYIVAGETNSFGAGSFDVYLIKTDANGNSGCNQTSTVTRILNGAIVGNPDSTMVGSGVIVNSPATSVTSPLTINATLCETLVDSIVADFVANDTSICEGNCVNFFDLSMDPPTSWLWSFPGAIPSSSTAQNPANICYETAGDYNVTLIATNINGSDTLTKTTYIIVQSCLGIQEYNDINQFSVYPNPYKDNALIQYTLLNNADVTLAIYNILGKKVSVIVDEQQATGTHQYAFSAKEQGLAGGVYLLKLKVDNKDLVIKLLNY